MEAIKITSNKDSVIISIDKSRVNKRYLLSVLRRMQLENLAQKAEFDEKVLDIAEEIKSDWWKNNKESFLS